MGNGLRRAVGSGELLEGMEVHGAAEDIAIESRALRAVPGR